jgi:hypothetical protein
MENSTSTGYFPHFREVRDDVLETTHNRQEPYIYGTVGRQGVYLKPEVRQTEKIITPLSPLEGPAYDAHLLSPPLVESGGRGSRHLFGAAGLGLIGGIFLAGVLAVFVFNSFVDDTALSSSMDPPKVVERLAVPTSSAQNDRLWAANVSGKAGTPIPLKLRLPYNWDRTLTVVKLTGLPANAAVSKGVGVGHGMWLVRPTELVDLTILLPLTTTGRFELKAELIKRDTDASVLGPTEFQLQVEPATQ